MAHLIHLHLVQIYEKIQMSSRQNPNLLNFRSLFLDIYFDYGKENHSNSQANLANTCDKILLIQFTINKQGPNHMSIISYPQFESKYRVQDQISQGTFGRVCKIREKTSKKLFALKKLSINRAQQLKDIQNQIAILSRFKHPFLVQLYEYYHFQNGNSFRHSTQEFGLVMQLASVSVQQLIRNHRVIGSMESIQKKIFGLVQVLAIFQSQNIAHRDIKPANILVFQTQKDEAVWKLADFGLAVNLNQSSQIQNIAGSFDYVSPILKRKFKFRNLKIKTNPFKDDVYSLGVTSLEVFTGFRRYTEKAHNKLREICKNSKIVELIDLMLTYQQCSRPCFKQLLKIIQKDFDYFQQVKQKQSENTNIDNRTHRKLYKFDTQDRQFQEINSNVLGDKTVRKKDVRVPQVSIVRLKNKKLQSIASIDGKIMCGCNNGEILFLNGQNQTDIIEFSNGPVHKNYVANLCEDKNGNIWSVGGDCKIIRWKKNGLLKSLLNNVKTEKIFKPNIFKSKNYQSFHTKNFIEHPQLISTTYTIPHNHPQGATCIFVIDQSRYAIGFNDGYIFIKWDSQQLHQQIHQEPINTIRINKNNSTLYTCSSDGCIKSIDIETLSLKHHMFHSSDILTGMQIFDEQSSQTVCVTTINGTLIYLNKNMEPIFKHNNQYRNSNYITSAMNYGKYLTLTEKGLIFDENQEQICDLFAITQGVRGWNCISFISNRQIIVGSFEGVIVIIQL